MKGFYRIDIWLLLLGSLFAVLLTGCADEETVTYRIPKEEKKETAAAAAPAQPATPRQGMTELPGMAAQAAAFTAPDWQAPADWQAQPLGTMRKGSWKVSGDTGTAEISVLVFPGDVGGDLANVNRWRQQVGLSPVTGEQLDADKELYPIEAGAAKGFYVTMNGPGGKSTTGALVPYNGATWFFKMTGDTMMVAAQKEAFLGFVRSADFK